MDLTNIQERNQLVMQNLNLARKVAHRNARIHPHLAEDLHQLAFLGLIKAAEKFDREKGYTFSTFADPWIRGEIQHFYRSGGNNLIRIPRASYSTGTRKVHVSNLDHIFRWSKYDREAITLGETIPDKNLANLQQDCEDTQELFTAIQALEEPLRLSIVLVYLLEWQQIDAARQMKVDPQTVRRRIKKGIAQLQAKMREPHPQYGT